MALGALITLAWLSVPTAAAMNITAIAIIAVSADGLISTAINTTKEIGSQTTGISASHAPAKPWIRLGDGLLTER